MPSSTQLTGGMLLSDDGALDLDGSLVTAAPLAWQQHFARLGHFYLSEMLLYSHLLHFSPRLLVSLPLCPSRK